MKQYVPLVVLAALTGLVYIRLGCETGTGCENVTQALELMQPHKSIFMDFIEHWSFG